MTEQPNHEPQITPDEPPKQFKSFIKSHKLLFAVLGVVLLLLIGGAILILPALFSDGQPKVGHAPLPTPSSIRTPSSTETPTLTTEVVAENLANAWDTGFTPDGSMFITERVGKLRIMQGNITTFLMTFETVKAVGEGGLMGLAVDPDFANNRSVYVCFNTASDIRIEKLVFDAQIDSLESQTAIVTGLPTNDSTFPGRHSGCRPRFGPDGYLWIGTGDVAIGTNPQDPNSLGGKVLRVDRDGKAAPGNLDPPFDARIYSYGHRNIQGLAFYPDSNDGIIGYSIEHGPRRDDEVNQLVKGNFGWDPVSGYNERVSMTDTKKFPDAIGAVWSSGKSTIAPSGGTILLGSKWQAWEGALAMAVLKDQHVRVLLFDDNGKLKEEIPILENQFGRIRSAVLSPDQNLYLTTDNSSNDKVIKVTPN